MQYNVPVYNKEEQEKKAQLHGIISTNYCLKNWNPAMLLIILLGSVFDANSLGRWIYEWTKFHYSPQHYATKVAGELWELLIVLGGKLQRARNFSQLIIGQGNCEIVEGFTKNGEGHWLKLKELLSDCEKYMWKWAKNGGFKMWGGSGAEFVEAMFSSDKQWRDTMIFMENVGIWCKEFDV